MTVSLVKLNDLAGFVAASLVDCESGLTLATEGTGINLDVASAGSTEVVRAQQRIAKDLGSKEAIEDILVTLGNEYHLIRPLHGNSNLFLYVALDRSRANLAMARHLLKGFEKELDFS